MADALIREAKVSDCESICSLMQELNKELPGSPASVITSKEIEKDAFTGNSTSKLYVCQNSDGSIVGYALFYYTYSTWEGRSVCLEELFVTPSSRRKGLGSSLMRKVVKIASENGCSRCNINTLPNNQFLISQGSVDLTMDEKWLFFRMNQENMKLFTQSCKTLDGIQIREAEKRDCIGIRKLIQDLADYEKIPDGPKIDSQRLEIDGHGDKVFYRCFVADREGELVGYSLFFFTYNSTGPGVYMEDLYVSPDHRGKGIGMALWGNLIKTSLNLGGNRCDFAVLDWNTPSIEFYKLKGAVDVTQKFHFYRMNLDAMQEYVK